MSAHVSTVVPMNDGGSYQGLVDTVSWAADGHGKRKFADGSEYTGDWRQGLMEGRGTMTFGHNSPTLDSYNGEWKANKFHGYGVLLYRTFHQPPSTRAHYTGSFKMGKMDGQGHRAGPGGDSYRGDWKEDKRHGAGRQIWADGSEYNGEWYDDRRHGSGTYHRKDGLMYQGDWENNKYHGHGKFWSMKDGSYVGEWVEGVKHGEGSLLYPDGSRFDGEWRANKPHGRGILAKPGQESVESYWVDGTPSDGKKAPQNIHYPWDLNDNPQEPPAAKSSQATPGALLKQIHRVLNLRL